MSDPHRCLAGSACRAADTHSGERVAALTAEAHALCEACLNHITSCAKQLPTDWKELRAQLGDRAPAKAQTVVRSSPTPAIPVSPSKDALMVEIVELADRAAAIVSEALETEQPDSRHGRRRYCGRFAPHEEPTLIASVAMIDPHIDKLAAAPAAPHVIWAKDGEQRELTEMSGVDIALAIVDVHNRIRAELGKTRLRHRYTLPCPRCAAEQTVGRDDGTSVVDCTSCGASWTDREYKFLVGLIAEEKERDISKYLLAENYWRLDNVQDLIDKLAEDETMNLPGAGTIIVEALTAIMAKHTRPADREIATAKATAKQRQAEEEAWAWSGEKPYRPPKRKRTKPKPKPAVQYAASSLSLDAPVYLPEAGDSPRNKCGDCNEIHAGECA